MIYLSYELFHEVSDLPQTDYKAMSDGELLGLVRSDESAYSELISRYLGKVRRLAHVYSYNHSDCDDLVSEGIIGLMNAVKSYDGSSGKASFSTYAYACIHNRIISALKKSSRINSCEENMDTLDSNVGSSARDCSPESIVMSREELGEVLEWMEKGLSKIEKSVFEAYMAGKPYSEISKSLGIPLKSVDNALLRVRRKLRSRL